MKAFLLLLLSFWFLMVPAAAQLKNVTADITPSAGGRYEHLTTDSKGNLYVFQNLYPETGRLWRYDQTKWTTLDTDGNGWGAVYGMVADADGRLYVWGTAAKGEKQKFFVWETGRWSTLPVLEEAQKPSGMFLGPGNELMLYGLFPTGTTTSFLFKWNGQQWEPVATTVKNQFLQYLFNERKCRGVVTDQNGHLYARLFKYEKPTRNYFAVCKNNEWTLLDTVAVTFNSTVRDMALDSKNNLYVAGFYADDTKSRCLARWNGSSWSILSKNEDPIECIAVNEQDGVLFAGQIGPYKKKTVNLWSNNTESTWAGSEEYFYEMALVKNTLYAVTGIGSKYIFKIGAGEFALSPASSKPSSTGSTATAPAATTAPVDRKDEKVQEVWAIYNAYLTGFYPAFQLVDKELRAMLLLDDKGNWPNRPTWKSSSYRIKQGNIPLRAQLEALTKRLQALALAKGANTLADDLQEAVYSYSRFSYATDDLMEHMAFVIITEDMAEAMKRLQTAGKDLNSKLLQLDKTKTSYQKRMASATTEQQTGPTANLAAMGKEGVKKEPAVEVKTKTHTFRVYSGWESIFKTPEKYSTSLRSSYGTKKPAQVFQEAPDGWIKKELYVYPLQLMLEEIPAYTTEKLKQDFIGLAMRRTGWTKDKIKLLSEPVTLSDGRKGVLLFYVCPDMSGMVGGYYVDCWLALESAGNKSNLLSYKLFIDGGCPDLPQKDYAAWKEYFKKVLLTIKPN
jgi:hypothetical protein